MFYDWYLLFLIYNIVISFFKLYFQYYIIENVRVEILNPWS